jgi:hypothetical protein
MIVISVVGSCLEKVLLPRFPLACIPFAGTVDVLVGTLDDFLRLCG